MTNTMGHTPSYPARKDPVEWNRFIAARPEAHILQSGAWGELKQRFGWSADTLLLGDDGAESCAGAQILYRRAAGLTIAYIPRGPVVDWTDRRLTASLLDAAAAEGRAQGASLLKIEPDLTDSPANRALMIELGFRPSLHTVQPASTVMVDLQGSESEILARMKSKWRYNIRLSQRKDVVVREAGIDDLATIQDLMRVTSERDGFAVHSAAYYAAAYELFVPEQAVFLLATYADRPLGAVVVFIAGDTAWYLWGASNNEQRNRMPNYALQWAGMTWARNQGARRYDLWGIPDAVGCMATAMAGGTGDGLPCDRLPLDLSALPRTGLWGVYRFKQGFGGRIVRHVGAWDRPISPVGHRVYVTGLAAQKQLSAIRSAGLRRLLLPGRQSAAWPALRILPVFSDSEWQTVLSGLPDPHVLQSWQWGDVKGQAGWQAERLAFAEGARIVGAAQFLWRQPLSNSPLRVAYVPKGPVMDWSDDRTVERVLEVLEHHARARKCIFVKIDPDVLDRSMVGLGLQHSLFRRGWTFSAEQIQFKNTAYTDLAVDESTLLAGMKSKWRYNVRLAAKRGISVRAGNLDDLSALYALYAETARRDGFLMRPESYYHLTWRTFLEAQADEGSPAGGALLLAEHEDETLPVAAIFLLRYGERAVYFNGASSERRRRDMPNYLLQWEALRWSRRQGCTLYDWWGAPTRLDDPDDGLQGVWRFKQGFGAHFREHIGAWDFVVSAPLYRAYVEGVPRILDGLKRLR